MIWRIRAAVHLIRCVYLLMVMIGNFVVKWMVG